MSRRHTLALLSPSQLNSKGGNIGAAGRSTKGIERRSSVVTKPTGPKQDTRPLNSKEYQNKCIMTIISYLTAHNFPYPVSPKTLASPTGKDFSAIVAFLFQQVDPVAFRIQGKVEDEVPGFFKRLNYPFQISKSALFAVGAPHSWPAVLAALAWLVVSLEYKERSCSSQSLGFDREKAELVDYLEQGYRDWMNGYDERCQQLDDRFAANYIRREEEKDAYIEARRKANEKLLAEIAQLRSVPDPVLVAKEKITELSINYEKLEKLVQQDEGLKQAGLRKVAERKADVNNKQELVAVAVANVEQLRQRVAAQSVTKEDLDRMLMERTKHAEVLAYLSARSKELERRAHEREMQLFRNMNAMETNAESYNQLARRLKLIPGNTKRAEGTNYELHINRGAPSQGDLPSWNLDLKGVIQGNLLRLRDMYRTTASRMVQDLTSLKERYMARLESSTEIQEENAVLQRDITILEAQLQAVKDAQEDKCKRLTAQAEATKAQLDELKTIASNQREHMKDQVSLAKLRFEQSKREAEAKVTKLKADLRQVINMYAAHKEFVTNTIGQTAAVVHNVKTEIVELNKAHVFDAVECSARS